MKIKCPACSDILEVPDSSAGNVVSCPCGKQLRVPGAPASPPNQIPSSALGAVGGGGAATGSGSSNEPNWQEPPAAQSGANPYARELPKSGQPDPLQGYAPPSGAGYAASANALRRGVRASLGQRVLGAFVDSFLAMGLGIVFAMAGAIVGSLIDSQDQDLMIGIAYLGFYVGLIATWILNAVLISMSGQSVGKKVAKTRIVDRENGTQSGFLQGVLLRNFVFGLITAIPCIGSIIGLVDLVMLFPEPNETLHDKLSRTVVVQA